MITCTCFQPSSFKEIRPWAEQISPEQDANIREKFSQTEPMNKDPLTIQEKTPSALAPKPSPIIIEKGPVRPYYTGYAWIDNAITDALKGKSQDLKDNVYQIIWDDFLPHNIHGMEESERLARIGLGVEKARYLADNFIDEKSRSSFMAAMSSIAKIGTKGTRKNSCEMEYQVKHVIE